MGMVGIVRSLCLCFLGATMCFGIALEIDVPSQSLEECGIVFEAQGANEHPLLRGEGYHHTSVHLPDLTGHEVTRKIVLYSFGAMLRTHHSLDRALQVVRHHGYAEHE